MHVTMQKLFRITLSSTSSLGSPIITLYKSLKFRTELINWKNDNAREKFYLMQTFSKARFFVEILKILKNLEILKIFEGGAPALRVIRAGTSLTVHRSLPS